MKRKGIKEVQREFANDRVWALGLPCLLVCLFLNTQILGRGCLVNWMVRKDAAPDDHTVVFGQEILWSQFCGSQLHSIATAHATELLV